MDGSKENEMKAVDDIDFIIDEIKELAQKFINTKWEQELFNKRLDRIFERESNIRSKA